MYLRGESSAEGKGIFPDWKKRTKRADWPMMRLKMYGKARI